MALWPAVLKRVEGAAAVLVHDDDFTVYQRVWRQLLAGSLRRSWTATAASLQSVGAASMAGKRCVNPLPRRDRRDCQNAEGGAIKVSDRQRVAQPGFLPNPVGRIYLEHFGKFPLGVVGEIAPRASSGILEGSRCCCRTRGKRNRSLERAGARKKHPG